MVGMKVKGIGAGVVLAGCLLLAGCQQMTLTTFIAGFFDPIVGSWQSWPTTTTTIDFVADRSFTRTLTNGPNTQRDQGTFAKDNATGIVVMTIAVRLVNGAALSTTPPPETYSVSINNEKTIMYLTSGGIVYQFKSLL